MRTVVAFGGEFKELSKFQAAVVQARRGRPRAAWEVVPLGFFEWRVSAWKMESSMDFT